MVGWFYRMCFRLLDLLLLLAIVIFYIVTLAKFPSCPASSEPAEAVNGRLFAPSSPIVFKNGDMEVTDYYRLVFNSNNNNDNNRSRTVFVMIATTGSPAFGMHNSSLSSPSSKKTTTKQQQQHGVPHRYPLPTAFHPYGRPRSSDRNTVIHNNNQKHPYYPHYRNKKMTKMTTKNSGIKCSQLPRKPCT